MTDEIKVLCPKCGSDKEPHWCNGRKGGGYFRTFGLCDACGAEFELPPGFDPFLHTTAYLQWWAAESHKAQLLAARKEIAELKARIEYLVKFRDMADPVIKKLRGDK